MHLKIVVEYDGTNYSGWQLQADDDSIQNRIETALARIFGEKVRVYGAGRTDAGVHAVGQVAAFDLPRPFAPEELKRALNALLPRDIVIKDVAEVAATFDPRRDAKARVYEYRVLNGSSQSAFEYRYSWHIPDALDLSQMQSAARVFLGTHDFAAFRSLGTEVRSTIREVFASEWRKHDQFLIYRVEATAFLRHMVRTMVAAMVLAGRGKLDAEKIADLLRGGLREQTPAAAPPSGLFLVEVKY